MNIQHPALGRDATRWQIMIGFPFEKWEWGYEPCFQERDETLERRSKAGHNDGFGALQIWCVEECVMDLASEALCLRRWQ